MSWPMQMPTAGPWTPGVGQPGMPAMTPMPTQDMSAMANFSQDQWTMMQQQNWQQWNQWQQQYSQWQSQYGEKYAQQMQAMQMQQMGGIPLPPSSAPPPAPPPPDKPPPPLPHENDQPLYGNMQAAHVPTAHKSHPPRNISNSHDNSLGNNTNNQWSYGIESHVETKQQPSIVNAEALKKLNEEERLFDIQFQKWEEEIKKWKRENVNHPDRKAYDDYEKKFEACRAQLLERRQQMKVKRDKLLGTTSQVGNLSGINNASIQPPQVKKPPVPNKGPQPLMSTRILPPDPNQGYSPNNQTINFQQNQNFTNQNNLQQNQRYNEMPPYNRGNNINIDIQDSYNYQDRNMIDSNSNSDSNFLPTNKSSKGIPGLDLVPEDKASKAHQADVIDITEENDANEGPKAPDYNTISKGINNILGDEKIMNILSMVRDQVTGSKESVNAQTTANYNIPNNNQWNNNALNSQQHVNKQNMGYNMQQGPHQMQQSQPPSNQGQQNRIQLQNQGQIPMQQGYPTVQQGQSQNKMFQDRPGGSQDPYYEENTPYNQNYPKQMYPNRSMQDNTMRPNMAQRPPMQDMAGQQKTFEGDLPYQPINNPSMNQPTRPKWVEEPLFTPSIIVEYEHKPLRLKARDFIEPVHTFDYNHKSKDDEFKRKDIEKEVDEELFSRKPRRAAVYEDEMYGRRAPERYGPTRDVERRPPADFERRPPVRDERDDTRSRPPPRDSYDERRRPDDRHDDRRRDDRDRYSRREEGLGRREDVFNRRDDGYGRRDEGFPRRDEGFTRRDDRDRERESRDRYKDNKRDDKRTRSRSPRDSRRRAISKESESRANSASKKSKESTPKESPAPTEVPKHIVMIDDILELPGREMRPEKIAIILRGPPGSGKSYLAKLIRDKEAEHGSTARIMSIDDYFMQELEIEEKDPATGKIVKRSSMKYEYDSKSEETYITSLKRAFKRTLTDGYFPFLIYDAVNDQLKSYADIWNFARQAGFQVYICTMELDAQVCYKRNIHNRSLEDIQVICSRFFATPAHHIQLDATTLLQGAAITDVHMEDVDDDVIMEDAQEDEVDNSFTSKWEKMDDASQLARLDGTSRPLRPSQLSMEDYLQLDDWRPSAAKPGKKSVRWADIEERRKQEKMRAIGFVVGQTDWNRMTDPTMGSSALTQTKYIERVRRH